MNCPACHRPGVEIDSQGHLFACETPECVVQTFDAEGAQSVEAPDSERPRAG